MADVLDDIRDRYDYAKNAWQPIRDEAAIDMAFVGGDPWNADDKKIRKNRPTVAPDELSQYRNQVTNALMSQPRGCKFSPVGNGANDKTAQFYQNKWREIEYRSKAAQQYILAADNALQRSYGFVKLTTDFASPRSANQELWVKGYPDPDVVLPDPDALDPTSSDQKFCFELQWESIKEHIKGAGASSRSNLSGLGASYPSWIKGDKILKAAYWTISTRPRKLLLVRPPADPLRTGPMPEAQMFEDEFEEWRKAGATVVRELRIVDYPSVKMYLTNGIEILQQTDQYGKKQDAIDWPGKYIPIVSCYGKIIYVPEGGVVTRKILSMTRFGRDPWKSYCYACSQQLEVLGMVPKAPLAMYEGQMDQTQLLLLQESLHVPKAAITFKGKTEATGDQILPPPTPVDYPVGQHLQGLEIVKEGYRRAIQAAMGSNFLPTQAQRRNEKSGVALDKIDQMATQGTFHFVYAYEGMIQQIGIIGEDLITPVHSQMGDLSTIDTEQKAIAVRINDPNDPNAVSTKGDHIVTVTSAPSSDSERDAVSGFVQMLVEHINMIAEIAGPKVAAAIFAIGVRMQNLGPMGDKLASLIEPPEFQANNGEAPNPQVVAMKMQMQHLQQQLQQAGFVIKTKQVEGATKFSIEQMKTQATSADKAADREVKLAVAELSAKVDRQALFLEERDRLGIRIADALDRVQRHLDSQHQRAHDAIQNVKDRTHEHMQGALEHQRALELGDQQVAGQLAIQDNSPEPTSDGASA